MSLLFLWFLELDGSNATPNWEHAKNECGWCFQGSSGMSGGGVVIRNSDGHLVVATAAFYGFTVLHDCSDFCTEMEQLYDDWAIGVCSLGILL